MDKQEVKCQVKSTIIVDCVVLRSIGLDHECRIGMVDLWVSLSTTPNQLYSLTTRTQPILPFIPV